MVIRTQSAAQTKLFARRFAGAVRFWLKKPRFTPRALVISLEGNLGAGKTTFTQGFAKAVGIQEKVASPTFVVMKKYAFCLPKVVSRTSLVVSYALYHLDCYRLERPEELLALDFADMIADPAAIVLIEWGDRIRRILPKDRITLAFFHRGKNIRSIRIIEPASLPVWLAHAKERK